MDKEKSQEEKTTTTSTSTIPVQTGAKTISAEDVKKESVQAEKDKKEQKKEKKELQKNFKKTKKKQKADYINFLLLLAIFLLLSIIITPPVLRKVMPKKEIINPSELEKSTILSCIAVNIQEQYKIESRTKYVDNNTIQSVITYTKLDNEEIPNISSRYSITTSSAIEEINFFKNIRGVSVINNQDSSIVKIYETTAKKHNGNSKFIKYFQDIDKQKIFYTSKGYTCEEITN